ncbi:MAG TPA: hypothetical protein PKE69_27310, partial [Pyrinomonadaceae bacterium]|nr:hypothetical protein [Pyrinomonadaceae bacterium]
KERINFEKLSEKGFDVKLSRGGIREIEFIAQALQLAHGGHDKWLRASHTLISLARLADRKILQETDLTNLVEAYKFLRKLEHRLQMENGLQTHLVPENEAKKLLIAKRMDCFDLPDFEHELKLNRENVSEIFARIFRSEPSEIAGAFSSQQNTNFKLQNEFEISDFKSEIGAGELKSEKLQLILQSLEKSNLEIDLSESKIKTIEKIVEISPHFAEKLAANPTLIVSLPDVEKDFWQKDYGQIFRVAVEEEIEFSRRLAILRKIWSRLLLEIVAFDVYRKISISTAKKAQTNLAEAGIESAIFITKSELEKRFSIKIEHFPFAVLGLGKLGSGSLDYESDLDLVLVFDEAQSLSEKLATLNLELGTFYAKSVEIFTNALSGFTREGNLYRVDLRLRPDGKNGTTSIEKTAFLNYLENRAAIWELLAYVKLRGVGGDVDLAKTVENEARKIIHRLAQTSEISNLKVETRRIRERLKAEKSKRKNEI